MPDETVQPDQPDTRTSESEAKLYMAMASFMELAQDDNEIQLAKEILNNSDLSVDDRIRRIEELESRKINLELSEEQFNKKQVDKIIQRKRVVTADMAKENQLSIKRRLIRFPYLLFLFGDYRKVKAFGESTGIIKPRIIPPRIKFNRNVTEELILIQKSTGQILSVLINVLKVAWKHLTKMEYNLLVQFKELCEIILSTPFVDLNYEDPGILNQLGELERKFFICNYRPEYPEMIAGSMIAVMNEYPRLEDKTEAISNQVKKILFQYGNNLSLHNILLALNMTAYRRFFFLKDLIRRDFESIVNTFDHDCDQETGTRIQMYVEDLIRQVLSLIKTRTEATKVKSFLQKFISEEFGDYDYSQLRSFYRACGKDCNFTIDSKNISQFGLKIFQIYQEQFEEFLRDKISIGEEGKNRVFNEEFFEMEVSRLKDYLAQFSKAYFEYPSFPKDRYQLLKKDPSYKSSFAEIQMFELIENITDQIVMIGKKLAYIHIHHEEYPDQSAESEIEPLQPVVLNKRNIEIPFWNKKIYGGGIIGDKTFGEAVSAIATLSFLIGLFFLDKELSQLLKKDEKTNKKLEDKLEELERVSDVLTYEKIRRRFLES